MCCVGDVLLCISIHTSHSKQKCFVFWVPSITPKHILLYLYYVTIQCCKTSRNNKIQILLQTITLDTCTSTHAARKYAIPKLDAHITTWPTWRGLNWFPQRWSCIHPSYTSKNRAVPKGIRHNTLRPIDTITAICFPLPGFRPAINTILLTCKHYYKHASVTHIDISIYSFFTGSTRPREKCQATSQTSQWFLRNHTSIKSPTTFPISLYLASPSIIWILFDALPSSSLLAWLTAVSKKSFDKRSIKVRRALILFLRVR